ncbi:sensory box histidine kinase/response regulator [Corallococcus coralloides]|uniref:histidine kinase n=1 Tax=Corallococcus coralloides TaxID=184914 RepID=A0A410S4J6_CORCK|nr:ATP-binding protein [Corallococcus coralloides]QAT89082.1 sensory box histidine kinase/response regulator [Corallococcus coralloides]
MEPRLSKRSAALAAGALVLLCALFILGRPGSTADHDHYRTQLRQLRVATSELEQDVLRQRVGMAQLRGSSDRDFDALAARARPLRSAPGFLPAEGMRSLNASLDTYLRVLEGSRAILAEATLAGVQGMAETAHVTLRSDVEGAPQVKGDRDRLIQVLTNLVSNAIKFSPQGASVVVAAGFTAAGRVRFSVTDQGSGIPEEKLPRLFGRFQQLDASDTRSKGGTGLGLAISQAIVEQHGGRIDVSSPPGQGATFHFTLEALRAPSVAPLPRDESRHNVLIVTADTELSALLRGLLSHEGYRVVRASTLTEAMQAVEHALPDALLVDTRMPDGTVLDWVHRLREQPRTRELPVLALAGRSQQGAKAAGTALLVDWLPTPVDETRLLKTLRYAMRQPGQARVLVVDDDATTRRVLCAQFERLGALCIEAADGESAVALARDTPPDLIVLDVGLPRLDGFEVVDILRQGKGRATPLIVFTGRELSRTDQRQLTLGITRHLTKARASEEELVASVRELLNGLLARRDAAAEPRKAMP